MSICPTSSFPLQCVCGECDSHQLDSRNIKAPVSSCRPNQPGSANLLGPHRKGGTCSLEGLPSCPGKSQLGVHHTHTVGN